METEQSQHDRQTPEDRKGVDTRLLDRLWRLENLYYITDKRGKVMKFKLNRVQKHLLKHLHSRNLILKARQLGMSTFIAILFLDYCLFTKNTSAAIVADKIENAKNIFKKIEFAWEKFPQSLKDALNLESASDSSSERSWSNGSAFKVGTTLHSGTYQCLHISEYGPLCKQSPEKAEDIKKSALPTVLDDGGIIFIESTAEGEGNDFHEMCLEAMELKERIKAKNKVRETDAPKAKLGKMDYRFFFFPWFQDPTYRSNEDETPTSAIQTYFNELKTIHGIDLDKEQKNWYVGKARSLKGRMKEQYPSTPDEAFLSTGNKQFNADILNLKMKNEVRDPIWMDGDLMVFTHYKRGHMYGVGADVADGVGLDSSTAVVIDFTANEVVATYRSNQIDPVNFAYDLARIGNMYGTCIVAPESNRTGHTTCVKLAEIYPNLYQFEMKGYAELKPTTRLGWSTTMSTKPRMMGNLKTSFEDEEDPLIIPDAAILREARLYAKDDNMTVTSAQVLKTTRHFDLLIATAIANEMRSFANVSFSDPKVHRHIGRLRERSLAGARGFR